MALSSPSSGCAPSVQPKGLLELPPSELRRVQLSVRAPWEHIAARLHDRSKVATTVRDAVASIEGTADEVLVDMVLRHVRAPTRRRLRRATEF